MARRYRMTPKRREALRKAQAASARKRRRGRNKRIAVGAGIGAGLVTTAIAGYVARNYVRGVAQGGPKRPGSSAPGKELDLVRIGPPPVTKINKETLKRFRNVGKPIVRNRIGKDKRRKKMLNYVESEAARLKHIATLDKKAYQARKRYHNRRRAGLPGRPPKNG